MIYRVFGCNDIFQIIRFYKITLQDYAFILFFSAFLKINVGDGHGQLVVVSILLNVTFGVLISLSRRIFYSLHSIRQRSERLADTRTYFNRILLTKIIKIIKMHGVQNRNYFMLIKHNGDYDTAFRQFDINTQRLSRKTQIGVSCF